MFVAALYFNETALDKLGARGVTEVEARQAILNGVAVANPRPRVQSSRLVRGRTDGGRDLVLVVNPHPYQPDEWFVMTGWTA